MQKDASGACTFSQRQGYVDMTLTNGFAIGLSPTDQPDHFKDAKGHKVVRRVQGETHLYKWRDGDEKTIAVSFGAPASGEHDEVGGGAPADLKDLIGGKRVGGEVDDEMIARGWELVKNDVAGTEVYSYWRTGKRCVIVHFDEPCKVKSIAPGLESSCAK